MSVTGRRIARRVTWPKASSRAVGEPGTGAEVAKERQERAKPLLLDCACFGGFRSSRTDSPHLATAITGPGREPPTAAFT